MNQTDRICVGAIAGAFGVSGDVRLKSFCARPEAILNYTPLYTEDGKKHFSIGHFRAISGGFSAQLSGITSKEEADALKGVKIYTNRSKLPRLPDDEFYYTDLIGLSAYDTGGTLIGHVKAIHNHGAGDILDIMQTREKKSLLLPFTRAFVPTIDLDSTRLIIDPPEESK